MPAAFPTQPGPIGIFDSGYGGLTILREIRRELPYLDYIYFGDNARAPYGNRSFDTVYSYTRECVEYLFNKGCHLVILACNTASAKALRTIQQKDLPHWDPERRVLGVLRPTTEIAGSFTHSGHLGILATSGTVNSGSYTLEINKYFPDIKVFQQDCPIWVPLIETGEYKDPAARHFFGKYVLKLLQQSSSIDAIILGCTHYPLARDIIQFFLPSGIQVIEQGPLAAKSLKEYLQRHPLIEKKISKNGLMKYISSEVKENFIGKTFYEFLGSDVEKISFEHYEH